MFYSSSFWLIPDRYTSLVSQFNQIQLELPFVKITNSRASNPALGNTLALNTQTSAIVNPNI
ncbi:MAG: hypothetical protein Ta2E_13230 [Mycoplasmoidaceae bacterium]|nr:MAG: hypothetical protein Ta2E_13230 [Mycoplasmoidaceae bacterium]